MYYLNFKGKKCRFKKEQFEEILDWCDPKQLARDEDGILYVMSHEPLSFCDHCCEDTTDSWCPLAVVEYDYYREADPCFQLLRKIFTRRQMLKINFEADQIFFEETVREETARRYLTMMQHWCVNNFKRER